MQKRAGEKGLPSCIKMKSNDNYRILPAKQSQFQADKSSQTETRASNKKMSYLIQDTWPQVRVNPQLHYSPLLSSLLSSFIDLQLRLHCHDIFGCRGDISQTTTSMWGNPQNDPATWPLIHNPQLQCPLCIPSCCMATYSHLPMHNSSLLATHTLHYQNVFKICRNWRLCMRDP